MVRFNPRSLTMHSLLDHCKLRVEQYNIKIHTW